MGSQTREIRLLNYPGKARSEPFCNRFSTSIFLDMTYTDRRNPNHPCICRATDPHFLTFLLLFLDPWGAPVMLSVHTFSSKINWIYFSDKLATHSWAKEATLSITKHVFWTRTRQTPLLFTTSRNQASVNCRKPRSCCAENKTLIKSLNIYCGSESQPWPVPPPLESACILQTQLF